MKDKALSVKVELSHHNLTKGGHILHEQEYNTGHGVQAILNEVCGEIRREPGLPEVQQKPVVHLLLAGSLGWKCGIPCLPVSTSSQPPQPTHRGRTKVDPEYAPQESNTWHGGAMAPPETTGLYPPSGEPVPGHAEVGTVFRRKAEESLYAQAL